jgi:hypothetical protein
MSPKLLNLSWLNSVTKESWPIKPLLKSEWVEMGDPAPLCRRTHGGAGAGALALVKPLPPKAVAGRPGFTRAKRPRLQSPPANRWAAIQNLALARSLLLGATSPIRNSKEPLSAESNKRTWYSSAYYTGPYQIEKIRGVTDLDLPKTVQPDPEIEIDTDSPQSNSNYIDNLCTHVAYGIYNKGFWVYVPPDFAANPIEIPTNSVWFGNTGQPASEEIFNTQDAAIKAAGNVNPDRVAYYRGDGGGILRPIIFPTSFTLKTAPTIVNRASIVVDELITSVTEELKDIMMMLVLRIAVSTAGAVIGRAAEVRRLKPREARAKAALENARARQNIKPIVPTVVTENVIRNAMRWTPIVRQPEPLFKV